MKPGRSSGMDRRVNIFQKIIERWLGGGEGRPEEAVFIHRRGAAREDQPAWRDITAITFDDRLEAAVSGVGRFGGCERGPEEEVVALYGPDAERVFAQIEEMLRGYYTAGANVRIVIRQGVPGAAEREVVL